MPAYRRTSAREKLVADSTVTTIPISPKLLAAVLPAGRATSSAALAEGLSPRLSAIPFPSSLPLPRGRSTATRMSSGNNDVNACAARVIERSKRLI